MPRRRGSVGDNGVAENSDRMEEQMPSWMEAFARAQAESNRQLVQALVAAQSSHSAACSPSPVVTAESPAPVEAAATRGGNLAKCTARFSGDSRDPGVLEAFIDAVQIFKECTNVSDEHALRGLPILLEGEAAVWYRGVKASVASWEDALARLRSVFGVPRPPHQIFREIFGSEQGDERAATFIARIRASLAWLPYDVAEVMQIDIVYGLLNRAIRKRLARDSVRSLDELLAKCTALEETLADSVNVDKVCAESTRAPAPTRGQCASSAASVACNARTARADSVPSGTRDSGVRTPPSAVTSAPPQARTQSSAPAHGRAAPPSSAATSGTLLATQTVSASVSTGQKGKLFCVYCRKTGHLRPECPKKSQLKCYGCGTPGVIRAQCENCNSNNKESFFTCDFLSNDVLNCADTSRPILDIVINGCKGTGMVDTAAKRSVAGASLYRLLQKKGFSFRETCLNIKLADGVIRDVQVKLADLEVNLADKVIPTTFVILPDAVNNDTLLGIDFLRAAQLVLDVSKGTWYMADHPQVVYPLRTEQSRNYVACAITDVLRAEEGIMLTPPERSLLAEVLTEYEDVFRAGGGPPTPFAEHRIDTGDHPPISVPPYRLNPSKKEIMKAELDKMLKDDIIEECESAWAAPGLMIPKPDNKVRFCVDYRLMNAVTKSDSYPLPVIDDLLQYTGKSCYMSTIDLQSGYWQVAVREEDRDKTAFVTPFGLYRFKRMPFGLRNAPATFQRLIDRFRSGATLKDVTILGYIDDLIVISATFEQHLQDLRAVLDRLRLFKLRANRAKCVFARDRVKYLGHVITPQGVSPDPEKVAAIKEMKEPTSLKHLRTFLQTCSWFRKYVPNFSHVAQPLTNLTKKDQTWKWGKEQADAFEELKRLLTTAPILTQPDYTRPFILRTDASNYAVGAVLLQGESPKDEHPIEYASRLLTPAERNYSTTEREALAVVWAVEKFRGYIDGHEVHVASDHQPLKWLLTLKSPYGRLVRWAMKLQAFNLKVDYTPGKANLVADTLSRPPCDEEAKESCGVCTVLVEVPRWDAATVREAQLADPETCKIIKELEGNEEVSMKRWTERGYHMNVGALYRYADPESDEPQIVVPASLRKEVMVENHDAPTAGHEGVERTLHRISRRYYFPGMRRYVEDYLRSCLECQRYKPSNQKPVGLLQTPVPAQRFEVLAVDLFGPLPKGPDGERWILIVEDCASKWVEVFALVDATAEACAKTLISEVFLRFGVPRRLVSDNGVQFVADVMQHAMFVLGVKQNLIPLYHPESNPVERRNRDLKVQLAIFVKNEHNQWPEALPFIRFALNSGLSSSTGQTPAYLTFARELRSPMDVRTDLRAVIEAENYVPQVTPYLLKLADTLEASKEQILRKQDANKTRIDMKRQEGESYEPGDLVLLQSHVLSNASKGVSSKLAPKRDGPYRILKKVSPTSYLLSSCSAPTQSIGKYHVHDLKRYHAREGDDQPSPVPVIPRRKRGRPRKARA